MQTVACHEIIQVLSRTLPLSTFDMVYRNHILPFNRGSRPSYDITWEEAVGVYNEGIRLFSILISWNKPQGKLTWYMLFVITRYFATGSGHC